MESEQTVKGLGSSNLPLSSSALCIGAVVAAAIAFVAVGSMGVASANPTSTISGRVLWDRLATPIDGADVTVRTAANDVYQARTRRDGTFSVIGLVDEDATVTIEQRGFVPLTCRYRLSPGGEMRGTFIVTKSIPGGSFCATPAVGGGQTQDVYIVR